MSSRPLQGRPDALARMRDQALTTLLVLEAFFIFVAAPLASTGTRLPVLVAGGIVATLAAIVVVASSNRLATTLAICAIVIGVAGLLLRVRKPSVLTEVFGHVAVILALLSLTWVVVRAVFEPGRITYHRIRGAIVVYLNTALMFTSAYRLVLELAPASFQHAPSHPGQLQGAMTMLYFSFTTLTSTGFGDLVPVHPVARSLAMLEATIGQLYPATLLARIVTLELEHRRR